jgi:hypothetical protein
MMDGVEELKAMLTADYGERCPDYVPDCINCTAWKAVDELVQRVPDLTSEDADMAMHWIDRYGAGIDDYPQLDRIEGRAALQSEGK